ncbi:MAG: hypothetical protein CL678_01560 [Bdellovibrionaceae bacterium]|nr:hypothetical protein [Pseudobdellovibrionaceae bacterium]|tara:strand:- start:1059 stop:2339 length:1281 start_codon:yes stop_codon:yes gene_type:complete
MQSSLKKHLNQGMYFLPYFILMIFSVLFTVNVPYFDDWTEWLNRHEIFQNHWSLKEIWLRNGPHYFPLTRILLTLFGKFELGPKTLILFNDLLTFSFLWIFQKIIKKETLEQNHWFENFLLGSFLLSFCQREVFFFSFNFHFVFIVFLLYSLQKAIQKNQFFISIILISLGIWTFSAWLMMVPCLLFFLVDPYFRKNKLKVISLLVSVLVFISIGAHLYIQKSPDVPQNIPFIFPLSFLRILGSPFAITGGQYQWTILHVLAISGGLCFVFFFVYFLIHFFKEKKYSQLKLLALPLFSILISAMMAYGRGESLDYIGAASRFTALVIPGWAILFYFLQQKKKTHALATLCLVVAFGNHMVNLGAEAFIRSPKLTQLQITLQNGAKRNSYLPKEIELIHRFHWNPEEMNQCLQKILTKKEQYSFFYE